MSPVLVAPLLLFTMGVVIGILWSVTRTQNPHLAWISAAFLLFSCAFFVQLLAGTQSIIFHAIIATFIYVLGTMALALGIMRRSSITNKFIFPLSASILIMSSTWWYSFINDDLIIRIQIINYGIGIILLYTAWRTRALIKGQLADKLLFWSTLILSLHFFPRTFLTISSVMDANSTFATSQFWIITLYVSGAVAVLLGLCIIIVTGLDFIATIQNERDTDLLTGTLNRRGLDRRLKHLPSPSSLMICDLDNFKQINDHYGHPIGDSVLQQFAHNLSKNVRQTDSIGRIGGEEFVIFMPNTTLHPAAQIAHLIRKFKAKIDLASVSANVIVTCSIGLIQLRKEESLWDAVKRADNLLYEAKRQGRDRIISENQDLNLTFINQRSLELKEEYNTLH